MTAQPTSFFAASAHASGSALNSKRKRTSWCIEEYTYEQNKLMRVRSPPLDRRQTFPPPPELIVDSSSSPPGSDGDQTMDMDGDMNMEMDTTGGGGDGGGGGFEYENGAVDQTRIRRESGDERSGSGSGSGVQAYAFGAGGSGGFGFGPGAMEDEELEDVGVGGWDTKPSYPFPIYPSLTPHPNPHHFSNPAHPSSLRPKSPLSAQSFCTTLRAPPSPRLGASASTRSIGLLQPSYSAPLASHATDIEKARAKHGPQCKSIPKLVMSPYPDPVSGSRSLWSQCGDCGAVERKM